jgi:branched-chain amino acid transport system ATP-binding protein
MTMLNVSDLHTHYGLSHILQGMSFSVGAAEIVALVGRNGVGKTTTLKTIAGWVAPTSGEISYKGQSIAGLAPDRICRNGIAIVPEDRRIFPGLTVQENLNLGLLQTPGRSGREKSLAIAKTFERFPRLKERRRQLGTTLSGGEQQMLAIARVLVGKPQLILIDEPTEGLAPIIVAELFEIIAGLRDEGISVILVEQNVYKALEVVDRAYVVERGQIVLGGDPRQGTLRQEILDAVTV